MSIGIVSEMLNSRVSPTFLHSPSPHTWATICWMSSKGLTRAFLRRRGGLNPYHSIGSISNSNLLRKSRAACESILFLRAHPSFVMPLFIIGPDLTCNGSVIKSFTMEGAFAAIASPMAMKCRSTLIYTIGYPLVRISFFQLRYAAKRDLEINCLDHVEGEHGPLFPHPAA